MKKVVWFILLAVCFFIGACKKEKAEKLCKLEIVEEKTSTLIATIEFMTQEDVTEFFGEEEEGTELEIAGEEETYEIETKIEQAELIPEYEIIVYQEKTKELLSLEDDEDYEKIMEYFTYEKSDIVKEIIETDMVKNMKLAKKFSNHYFHGTEKFFENLSKAIKKIP